MRLWLTGAFGIVSLITAAAVYSFGDNPQALVAAVMLGVLAGFLIAVAISHRVVSLARETRTINAIQTWGGAINRTT